MSVYSEVEQPFLQQLAAHGWTVVDQGCTTIPQDPAASLRTSFREWLLPGVFDEAVRRINTLPDGKPWLTDRQLDDLRGQLLRRPNRTLLGANEAIQALLFKTQVDVNEATGEADPVVQRIDFTHSENNTFHAINQFRIGTPGCVKAFRLGPKRGGSRLRTAPRQWVPGPATFAPHPWCARHNRP